MSSHRARTIGGSEVAIICGLQPWGKTPLDLFKSKMEDQELEADDGPLYWGNVLEAPVLDKFTADLMQDSSIGMVKRGFDPHKESDRFMGQWLWEACTPDALVFDTNGNCIDIVEVKTSSLEKWQVIPDYYQYQMLWNIYVMRQTYPTIKGCWMPSLHNTNRYQCIYMTYEELGGDRLLRDIRLQVKQFVEDHLWTGIAPSPSNYDESREAYRIAKGIRDLDNDEYFGIRGTLDTIKHSTEMIDKHQKRLNDAKFYISEMMRDTKKFCHEGRTLCSRVTPKGKSSYIKINLDVFTEVEEKKANEGYY